MNQLIAARLYLLFALLMLIIGWKICHDTGKQLAAANHAQASQLDAVMGGE